MLVKNISNPKAQLHAEATQVKSTLVNYLLHTSEGSAELSSAFALKLLSQKLFGPNTLSRLSIKKHVDLVKVLSAKMEQKEVRAYFEAMRGLFETPNVEDTFGKLMQFKEDGAEEVKKTAAGDSDEEEDPMKKDEKQKADIIRTYALNQLASIPNMFRGKSLEPQVLADIIAFLVHLNYYNKKQSEDIH